MSGRRLQGIASAAFLAVMLGVLVLIARNGVSGTTGRALFGILLVAWSAALSGFPFILGAMSGHRQRERTRLGYGLTVKAPMSPNGLAVSLLALLEKEAPKAPVAEQSHR